MSERGDELLLVRDIMVSPVITVGEEDTIADVAKLMTSRAWAAWWSWPMMASPWASSRPGT